MFKRIPISLVNRTPLKKILDRLSEGVIPVFMLHRIAFPVKKDVIHNVLTKVDYIADRIRDKNFSEMFEMTYGIK